MLIVCPFSRILATNFIILNSEKQAMYQVRVIGLITAVFTPFGLDTNIKSARPMYLGLAALGTFMYLGLAAMGTF